MEKLGLGGLLPGCRREERVGERIEARPRAGAPDALQADTRALDQQEQLVGDLLGLGIAGLAHQGDEALALPALVYFDHAPRRMAGLGELDRRVGERAAAAARLGGERRDALQEIAQLRLGVARVRVARRLPECLGLLGEL